LGGIVALFVGENRGRVMLLVSAAAFSHWLLDLVVHTPDLPLYDNTAKVGLGLWRHVGLSFPLELIVLGAGTWVYVRAMPQTSAKGRAVFWGYSGALAALQAYANFGPPPASPQAMALTALSLYVALAILAGLVERTAARV
jgi:hypothetical protein